ncbi:MAG: pilus assembly protein TadG-related protein [Acidimicrobiia bacterium]
MVHRLQRVAVTGTRSPLRKFRAFLAGRAEEERGAVAVMVAIMLTVMLGICALVVDLGNARQQRRAAQNSADAAALAAGETVEAGNGTIDWNAVVAQVKKYALVNDGIPTSAWNGCTDSGALTYRPDSTSSNACISADRSTWPAVGAGTVGDTPNRIRIKLPSTSVKTYFGKALGISSLTTGATAQAKVVMTVNQILTVEHIAGGPCALCVLGSGLALNGQNGDVTITGGNVVVNSTAGTAASLNPNGHVTLTTSGGAIGGPNAPGNFSGSGFSPAPTHQDAVADPLANVPQCGNGAPGTTNYCPTNVQNNGNSKNAVLSPGIYSSISGSHQLNPGIYVLTGDLTLNGNDLITGSGVMLYFACSGYPGPCTAGQSGAGIKATGNGALRITGITQAQCDADVSHKLCNYVGMMLFADRNNTATMTWRGNGTNENGALNSSNGTIYLKSGTFDLRGNGYTLASQIVTDKFTMEGNPSTVTIAYDLSKNYSESHDETHTSYSVAYDNNGLSG